MKLKHALIIAEAIKKWMDGKNAEADIVETGSVVCSAVDMNWKIFYAAKVEGNSLIFLSGKLYPYLTACQVVKGLMDITGYTTRRAYV